MQNFENLDIWKRSCRLAIDIYQALKSCGDTGLKDQLCRAAVSVPSNIAEGCARASQADFKRFLAFASGSLAEARTQLYIARCVGLMDEKKSIELIAETKEISAMITKFSDTLK